MPTIYIRETFYLGYWINAYFLKVMRDQNAHHKPASKPNNATPALVPATLRRVYP